MKKIGIYILSSLLITTCYCQSNITCLSLIHKQNTSADTLVLSNKVIVCVPHNYSCYWDNGKTIRISFFNGSKKLQTQIISIAKKWEKIANIKFELVAKNVPSQIIIILTNDGYISSMQGNLCMSLKPNEPTMYMDTTEFSNRNTRQAIVLHLFGHVLGFHDEVIAASILKYNSKKVISYFDEKKNIAFGIDKISFINQFLSNKINSIKYDSKSVMQNNFFEFTSKKQSSKWNSNFSAQDKALAKHIYPFKKQEKDLLIPTIKMDTVKFKIDTKNGVHFYPVIKNIQHKFLATELTFLVLLYNEEMKPIYTNDNEYNINNQLGTYYTLTVPQNFENINTSTNNDIDIFIPKKYLQLNSNSKTYAVVKLLHYNHFVNSEAKFLYISKPILLQ